MTDVLIWTRLNFYKLQSNKYFFEIETITDPKYVINVFIFFYLNIQIIIVDQTNIIDRSWMRATQDRLL